MLPPEQPSDDCAGELLRERRRFERLGDPLAREQPSLLLSDLSVPAGRVAHVESGHSMIVHVREQSRI